MWKKEFQTSQRNGAVSHDIGLPEGPTSVAAALPFGRPTLKLWLPAVTLSPDDITTNHAADWSLDP